MGSPFVKNESTIAEDKASEPFRSEKLNDLHRAVRTGENSKMIYRRWSLLTGPPAILGGIVVSLAVFNFFYFKEDPFLTPKKKKQEPTTK